MIDLSRRTLLPGLAALAAIPFAPTSAQAASRREIDESVNNALNRLYTSQPATRALVERAKGALIFPNIVKAGLLVGGEFGEGALRRGSQTAGYYNVVSASFGLQAGAQSFSMALLFMTDSALRYLDRSDGWQIGTGPSFVVADEGLARHYSSTTVTQEVIAYIFGQQGLMAGIGIEGAKITRIHPD